MLVFILFPVEFIPHAERLCGPARLVEVMYRKLSLKAHISIASGASIERPALNVVICMYRFERILQL